MQHLEVSGAVRHIYIYIYIYVIRRLKVNTMTSEFISGGISNSKYSSFVESTDV